MSGLRVTTPNSTPRKRKTRKVVWLVLFVLVAYGLWTVWHARASSRLSQAVAEAKRSGLLLSFEELLEGLERFGGQPAPEENAAPLYEAAIALMKGLEEPEDGWEERAEDGGPSAAAERLLPRYEEVFRVVEAASKRPRCVFDLAWRRGFNVLLRHLTGLREISYVYRQRIALRARAGDIEGALQDTKALFSLARALREEPIVLSQLVRVAISRVALHELKTLLPQCESATAALEKLEIDAARGAMAFALHGEAHSVVVLSEKMTSDVLTVIGSRPAWWLRFNEFMKPYLLNDAAYMLEALGRIRDVYKEDSYPEALERAALELEEVCAGGGYVADKLLPHYNHWVHRSEARLASTIALAQLAARFLDHRRAHGDYPSGVESFGEAAVDPMSGEPFVLQRDEAGWVLKSPTDAEVSWPLED